MATNDGRAVFEIRNAHFTCRRRSAAPALYADASIIVAENAHGSSSHDAPLTRIAY